VPAGPQSSWFWRTTPDQQLQIASGTGEHAPQYGVLHLDSSYLRLIPAPQSGWGSSVVLLPTFWAGGLHQGGAVAVDPRVDGRDLLLNVAGSIAGLQVTLQVRLSPPENGKIVASVDATSAGDVTLDQNRPGEVFKPLMLSSMHLNSASWDSNNAYVDCDVFPLPSSGWIVHPPSIGGVFGLVGGWSSWKSNAPTVEIKLATAMQITGWMTASSDPNDDNCALWSASDVVLRHWAYAIVAAARASDSYIPQLSRQERRSASGPSRRAWRA
jgi:hypothetical protein